MVGVRRPRVPQRLAFNPRVGPVHVVHPPVKIIGRTPVQNRAPDQRRIRLETQRPSEHLQIALRPLLRHTAFLKLVLLPAPPLTAHCRHRALDPPIRPRDVHGQISPHGVPMDSQPIRVHFRLLLQKGQPPAAGHRQQVPVVVLRVLTIFKKLLRPGQHRTVPGHVQLSRIHTSPLNPGIPRFRLLHGLPTRPPTSHTAPAHRQNPVPLPGQKPDFRQGRPAAAPVNLQHPRHTARSHFRDPVKSRDPGRHPLVHPHQIPHRTDHHTVLLPFPDRFHL